MGDWGVCVGVPVFMETTLYNCTKLFFSPHGLLHLHDVHGAPNGLPQKWCIRFRVEGVRVQVSGSNFIEQQAT